MRYVLMTLALTGLVSCGEDATLEAPLSAVGNSGISGTLSTEETPGKSGLGEMRFAFTVDGAEGRQVVGFIRGRS